MFFLLCSLAGRGAHPPLASRMPIPKARGLPCPRRQHYPRSDVQTDGPAALEMWGGLECTVNRVGDDYFTTSSNATATPTAIGDLDRFAALGIRAHPLSGAVGTHRAGRPGSADWSLGRPTPGRRCASLGITPIVGLVHHGSGPRHTEPGRPGLRRRAGRIRRARSPPLSLGRVLDPRQRAVHDRALQRGLYGLWYPHAPRRTHFVRALLNQCRAVVLAMRAIRARQPGGAAGADRRPRPHLQHAASWPSMADFYNERRWLAWDLLCGTRRAATIRCGTTCCETASRPPSSCGSPRTRARPTSSASTTTSPASAGSTIGSSAIPTARTAATARRRRTPTSKRRASWPRRRPASRPLLQETWERYGIPLAVTEAHIDANREDQLRWLLEIWDAAQAGARRGADMRAVTVWSLLGSFDWNCLVTRMPGLLRAGPVRRARPARRARPRSPRSMRELARRPAGCRIRCCRARAGGAGRAASWPSRSRRAPPSRVAGVAPRRSAPRRADPDHRRHAARWAAPSPASARGATSPAAC